MKRRSRNSIYWMTAALAGLLVVVLLAACGSDEKDPIVPADPVGVTLEMSGVEVQVSDELEITAVPVYDRAEVEFDWYVNGELGGHELNGTITQTNPAVFTAPAAIPAGGSVEIKAIWRDDEEIFATEILPVLFTIRHVDAENGTDVEGGGSLITPLRTITFGFGEAETGDTVQVHPGTYDSDLGEADQFFIPDGVVLKGMDREACILYGGSGEDQTMQLGYDSTVECLTLRNWGEANIGIYSTWIGTIRNVKIPDSFNYSAIRCSSEEGTLVEDCVLINTVDPLNGRCFELVYGSHATVRNCTISDWTTGIFCNTTSDPLVENCTITGNTVGVEVYGAHGEPPIGTDVDLGGGARGSVGGNIIQGNSNYGIWVRQQVGDVYAMHNTWDADPPTYGPPAPADILIEYDDVVHVILQ